MAPDPLASRSGVFGKIKITHLQKKWQLKSDPL
jgi:hypothetical protein